MDRKQVSRFANTRTRQMKTTEQKHFRLPNRSEAEKLYTALRPTYEATLQELQQKFRKLAEDGGLSVTIKYRVKRFNNYCEKLIRMSKLQNDATLQITDLLGIRIVCPFLEDLEIMERLIAEHCEVLEMEHKAEQHSFREFGYDSVHLLVRTAPAESRSRLPYSTDVCEIQLRTILQEAWAEVEHELVYKSDIDLPNDSIRRKLASLNASLGLSDLIFQEIRDYQKEIRLRELKRRQSLDGFTCSCGGDIEISSPPEPESEPNTIPDDLLEPAHLTSKKLEKLMLAALEAHSNNQFQTAIDIYGAILRMKLEPVIRSLVYNHRGMALFALSEYQKGIEDFSKAVEFNEENFRAWGNRGLVYRLLERFDLSLQDYGRVIEMRPQQYEGYWGRAQTYYEMKLFSSALNDCHKALERKTDFVPAQELEKALRRQIF